MSVQQLCINAFDTCSSERDVALKFCCRCYEWEYAECNGGNLTCAACQGISVVSQSGWVLRSYADCQVGFYRAPCLNRSDDSKRTSTKSGHSRGRGQKARLALKRRKGKTKLPRLVLAEHAYVETGVVYLDCFCEATSMTKCGM